MGASGFALFETAIGSCGIAWSERGIVGVQLPEGSARATRSRLLRRFPSASEATPPADVQRTIADIVALLGGERRDLGGAVLDSGAVPDFNRRVYDIARAIPAGSTLSYGEVAECLGDRNVARDVAQALGQIRSRSLCRVTASWRPAAKLAGFRRPAVYALSFAYCRSNGRNRGAVRRCSLICRSPCGPPGADKSSASTNCPDSCKYYLHGLVRGKWFGRRKIKKAPAVITTAI